MQVVGGEQYAAGRQHPGVAKHTQRLDSGGGSALHVAGAAARESAIAHRRGHERQMHGVEMAVHLQRRPRAGPEKTDDDGRRGGVTGGGSLNAKSIGGENGGKLIECAAGIARPAGHADQPRRGIEQSASLDGLFQKR